MSIKNLEVALVANPHHDRAWAFTGLRELGFNARGDFVIDAWTTPTVAPGEPRGGYFTVLPISSLDYRRTHRTETAFARHGDRLVVYDDWGDQHVIAAPSDIIDALVAECMANEIPCRSTAKETP